MMYATKPEGTVETRVITRRTPMFGKKGKWKRKRAPMVEHWEEVTTWVKGPNTGLLMPMVFAVRMETVDCYCLN